MSEVGDACQIVMVSGKMIAATAALSLKMAMLMMKVYNTLYLGKWKGSTSFARFRAIKGDDYEFINICSEDPEILMKIEQEMEAHKLLFAKLPDLCGGDGNTQYVIAKSDLHIFAAFLMDHVHGELKNIKVGPIAESDYARTAVHPESGEYTEEFQELNRSAQQQYRLILTEQRSERVDRMLLPERSSYQIGTKNDDDDYSVIDELTVTENGNRRTTTWQELSEIPQVRIHNERLLYREQFEMIYDAPMKEHEKWAIFPIHDGEHVVIIPKSDLLEGNTGREQVKRAASPDKVPRAILHLNQNYIVIDMATGMQQSLKGADIVSALRMPNLSTQRVQLENLSKNVQKNIGSDAILPSPSTKKIGGR